VGENDTPKTRSTISVSATKIRNRSLGTTTCCREAASFRPEAEKAKDDPGVDPSFREGTIRPLGTLLVAYRPSWQGF